MQMRAQGEKRANSLIDNYKFSEAVAVIDSIMAETNDLEEQKEWVSKKALCLKKLYRFDDAVAALTEWNERYFVRTNHVDIKIMSELAECHSLNGNLEGALSSYMFLCQVDPGNIYYALQKTLIMYKSEDYLEAVSCGKEILQRDSSYAAVLSVVGNSYNKVGLQDSAMVYYNRLLRLNPMDASTVSKKANILFSKNKYEDVAMLTSSFLQIDSTNLTVNPIYGLALHMAGKYNESLDVFLKQQRLGDDSYGTNYYIGLNYFLLDKKFDAEPYFAQAYYMDSTNVNTVYYYASSKAWQTYTFDEAKVLFDKALKMMTPDSTMMCKIYAGYALGYYISGDFKNSIKYYKLSYEQNPKYSSAIKAIGYGYEMLKEYSKAQQYYRQYLGLLPPEAKSEREWTEGKIMEMESEKFMMQ